MEQFRKIYLQLKTFFKWVVISCITGLIVGGIGILFYNVLSIVTNFRINHPYIILGLPLGGLLIALIYKYSNKDSKGTNLVIEAIQSNEDIPLHMTPIIFISTAITHLFGGSAGREGAALQIGGSIGNTLGKIFHLDEKDTGIIIMCGMSGAFSAVFGTPIAASLFPMEVVSVGVMYYAALVPCVISSLVGYGLAQFFNIKGENFIVHQIPSLTTSPIIKVFFLGILCALISVMFCIALHKTHSLYAEYIPNKFLAIVTSGLLIIGLTFLLKTSDYLGAGMNIIKNAMDGNVRPEAFFMKILFTSITLGAGYKGGEIVPSFFIGSTFGCLFGHILGLSPSLCAALGMIGIFCGVTNSPITSLIISFELFGYVGIPYFLIIVATSYMLSGYYSLYGSQRIVYSKLKTKYINKETI